MPVFTVTFTMESFQKLPDDSQVKVEKLVRSRTGIVAVSNLQAVAIAARDLPTEQFARTEEEFIALLGSMKVAID